MTYDSARQRVVMGGGPDTWEWDGAAWSKRSSGPPFPRIGYGLAYCAVRQTVVMFGDQPDTWEWDGAVWSQVQPANSPSSRLYPGMVYDSARQEVVLFGGITLPSANHADTWIYSHPAATYAVFGNGCGIPVLSLTNAQPPRLGQPFEIQLSNLPTFRAGAVFTGVSNANWSGISLPFDLTFLGGAGCMLYVSGEIASPFTSHTSTTHAWGFAVPNDPDLAGVQFFNQGLVVDPLTGLLSTNGGVATIGY